jgi:hypothetical protein
MSEKPIIFCGAMATAINEGRKTMTRRVARLNETLFRDEYPDLKKEAIKAALSICPYHVGKHLWVREPCWIWGHWYTDGTTPTGRDKWRFNPVGRKVRFDKPEKIAKRDGGYGWVYRHARFMPYWACRNKAAVTDVRVERLQSITEADARAEGFGPSVCADVFRNAPGWQEAEDAYYAEDGDGSEYDGWYCYGHAKKRAGKKGSVIAGCTPESDGPAYCDECSAPLVMSLTQHGIEMELLIEDDPNGEHPEHFPASGLDASIACMIADGFGDLQERHHGRLAQIGFATCWEQLNAKRDDGRYAWAKNPWVWVIGFKKLETTR